MARATRRALILFLSVSAAFCLQASTVPRYFDFSSGDAGDVSMDGQGNFVVVWGGANPSPGGDDQGILGQRFTAAAIPSGPVFQVNTNTTDGQFGPAVSMDDQGNFVVTWQWHNGFSDIRAQRFASDGTPQGGELDVSVTLPEEAENFPDVAYSTAGTFMVVWSGKYCDVRGRVYSSAGDPIRDEFGVAAIFPGEIDAWADGFIVVSEDELGVTSASRFDSFGFGVGHSLQVNQTVDSSGPVVASDADNDFIVVWGYETLSSTSILGRRFASDGSDIGGEFQVASSTTGTVWSPDVVSEAEGNFFVMWTRREDGISSIRGQRYDPGGAPVGGEFEVSDPSFGSQYSAKMANNAERTVAVWNSATGLRGAVFLPEQIFADGFESGNVSAWSFAAP